MSEEFKPEVSNTASDVVDGNSLSVNQPVSLTNKTLKELVDNIQELLSAEDRMARFKEVETVKAAFYKRLLKEKADAGLVEELSEPDESEEETSTPEVTPETVTPETTEGTTEVTPETTETTEVSETATPETPETPEAPETTEATTKETTEEENPFHAIEQIFKDLYATYKKERAEYNKAIDAEREQNLKIKTAIIEELKVLNDQQDDLKDLFPKFRDIQDRWRSTGPVPAQNRTELNNNYQYQVERFYDMVKINKDLRDLDFKKNLEQKEDLCAQAEALIEEPGVVSSFNELQKLHELWKEIGPVDKEHRESIWERFKAASSAINRRHQEYFEGQKERQQANLEAKEALCVKAEDIAAKDGGNSSEWNALAKEIEEIRNEWKTIGFATKKENQKIYDRFKAACDAFYARKRDFFASSKDAMNANMEKKLAIVEKAEELKLSTEWKKTTDALIQLQQEWKTIGPIPRNKSEQLWKRFRAACDEFFASKEANSTEGEYSRNLKAKKELIAEIKAYELQGTEADNAAANEFTKKWNAIGFVPFKAKANITESFKAAMKEKFPEYRKGGKQNVSGNIGKGFKSEKDKLVAAYNKLQQDIATYENNIGFFSTSKGVNPIVEKMKEQIALAKSQLEELREKIRKVEDNENAEKEN